MPAMSNYCTLPHRSQAKSYVFIFSLCIGASQQLSKMKSTCTNSLNMDLMKIHVCSLVACHILCHSITNVEKVVCQRFWLYLGKFIPMPQMVPLSRVMVVSCAVSAPVRVTHSAERLLQCVISQSLGSKRRERKKKKERSKGDYMSPSFSRRKGLYSLWVVEIQLFATVPDKSLVPYSFYRNNSL